ncbi:MAG: hypothetical protein AB1730_25270 [Myxococcota bacterium]
MKASRVANRHVESARTPAARALSQLRARDACSRFVASSKRAARSAASAGLAVGPAFEAVGDRQPARVNGPRREPPAPHKPHHHVFGVPLLESATKTRPGSEDSVRRTSAFLPRPPRA